jgi:hypothetical protein
VDEAGTKHLVYSQPGQEYPSPYPAYTLLFVDVSSLAIHSEEFNMAEGLLPMSSPAAIAASPRVGHPIRDAWLYEVDLLRDRRAAGPPRRQDHDKPAVLYNPDAWRYWTIMPHDREIVDSVTEVITPVVVRPAEKPFPEFPDRV